ncbi:MAG: hypothetical protein HC819_11915 [Cyclobacteriaceae bacterium]|nr:hypothetical protein [Cyclobacteriaceae bacterium]
MNKPNTDIQSFLTDEQFVKWVLNPDNALNKHWKDWMTRHPAERHSLMAARQALYNLKFQKYELDTNESWVFIVE